MYITSAITFLLAVFTTGIGAAPISYVVSESKQFGSIDLATGAYAHVGYTPEVLIGLGINNGMLYGVDTLDRLVAINPTNAATTVIGATGIPNSGLIPHDSAVPVFTSLTTGALFAFDWASNLYSINPATGAGTLVAATGIPQRSSEIGSIALAADATSLYYLIQEIVDTVSLTPIIPGSLYRVNPATGASVLLTAELPNLPFTNAGFADGSVYAFRGSVGGFLPPPEIWRLSTIDGSVLSITAQDPALGDVWGAVQPIPEPSTLLLFSSAVGALAARKLRS
jgi:hypothetical protein